MTDPDREVTSWRAPVFACTFPAAGSSVMRFERVPTRPAHGRRRIVFASVPVPSYEALRTPTRVFALILSLLDRPEQSSRVRPSVGTPASVRVLRTVSVAPS